MLSWPPMEAREAQGLLAWQWSTYRRRHQDPANLVVHILTVPVFILGNCVVVVAPFAGLWTGVWGAMAMVGAMALQGWTHRREPEPPEAFRGALDVLARILSEQWITFPRYVLSGELARAWSGRRR